MSVLHVSQATCITLNQKKRYQERKPETNRTRSLQNILKTILLKLVLHDNFISNFYQMHSHDKYIS